MDYSSVLIFVWRLAVKVNVQLFDKSPQSLLTSFECKFFLKNLLQLKVVLSMQIGSIDVCSLS